MKKLTASFIAIIIISMFRMVYAAPSDTDFISAIYRNDLPAVSQMLSEGANPNATSNGMTALYAAVAMQNVDIVKTLVAAGADINKPGIGGVSVTFTAQSMGNQELLEALYSNVSDSVIPIPKEYPQIENKTSLIVLDDVSLSKAKKEASQLNDIDEWNLRVAYFLGSKGYSIFSNSSEQRVQLITPYSIAKYAYYVTERNFKEPKQMTINNILSHNNVAWLWVWSNGAYDAILGNGPAPGITNVVIRKGNKIYQPLPREKYTPDYTFMAANINRAAAWAFPIEIFSNDNTPFEIVLVDSQMHQKPLTINKEDLVKCQ